MKNLYSLILSDEVIKRIDTVAQASGTNRSNLINQILADYVSYTTPEKRIQDILMKINEYLSNTEAIISNEMNGCSLSLKTALDYKYRPTVKYCVELYRNNSESIGELKVLYRINSQELLYNITRFFEIIISVEEKLIGKKVYYEVSPGRFVRQFIIPDTLAYSYHETARAIGDYVKNFDAIMKKFLSGKYTSITHLENDYKIYLSKSILI